MGVQESSIYGTVLVLQIEHWTAKIEASIGSIVAILHWIWSKKSIHVSMRRHSNEVELQITFLRTTIYNRNLYLDWRRRASFFLQLENAFRILIFETSISHLVHRRGSRSSSRYPRFFWCRKHEYPYHTLFGTLVLIDSSQCETSFDFPRLDDFSETYNSKISQIPPRWRKLPSFSSWKMLRDRWYKSQLDHHQTLAWSEFRKAGNQWKAKISFAIVSNAGLYRLRNWQCRRLSGTS